MQLPGLQLDHALSRLSARIVALLVTSLVVAMGPGCAPPPEARALPAAVSAVPEASPLAKLASSEARPDDDRAIPTIELPQKTACRLDAVQWSASSLRLSPAGPIYGVAHRVERARVSIADDVAKGGIVAELDAGPIVTRGFVSADELELYPQKMLLLAGLFVPARDTRLVVSNAAPEKLRVRLLTVPPQLASFREPLEAVTACFDVGLAPSPEQLDKALGDPLEKALVRGGTPLSLSPGGSPAFVIPGGEAIVNVLERRDNDVRVAWSVVGGTVVGWVPKGAAISGRFALGSRGGFGRGFGTGETRLSNPRLVQCSHDVPLGAEVDGRRAIVGRVLAGSPLQLSYGSNGLLRARVPKSAVRLADGADWFVHESDIQDCPEHE